MDRSDPSVRRTEQRRRFRQRAMMVVFACIACAAVAYAMWPAPAPLLSLQLSPHLPIPGTGPSTAWAAPAPLLASVPAARPVYRHSVVPGGVADAAELAQIVRSDKVVAVHYAEFDVKRAYPVTVTAARAVYVSYRKGDQVYWTARKAMLRAGETLLSDGRSEIRVRCANRISSVPRLPVEPQAPPPESLDILVFEGAEAGLIRRARIPKAAPPRFPPDRFMPPPPREAVEPPLPDPAPFVPPHDSGRPGPPHNPPLPPPPGADVPEPATGWLMAAAMVAMVALRRKR